MLLDVGLGWFHTICDITTFPVIVPTRQIGENLIVPPGVKMVDAYGQLVIPGGVDANTNLQAPQKGQRPADGMYQGTRAALSGGTTTISQNLPNNLSILLNWCQVSS